MKFLLIYFLCFSFIINEAGANQPPISFTHNTSQQFRFTPGQPGQHQRITNSLLQFIAQGNNKIRAFTNYTLDAQILVSIQNRGIRIAIKEASITGDVFYRDFLIDELLMPDKLNLQIDIKDIAGNTLETIYLNNFDFGSGNDTLVAFSSNIILNQKFVAEVIKAEYFYSDKKIEELNLWNAALTSYYEAGNQIEQAFHLISNLNPDNLETMLVDEFHLCRAESIAGEVMYAPFQKVYFTLKFDPLNISVRLNKLIEEISNLRRRYNFNISHIDSLLFSQANFELAKGNPTRGKELLRRVLIYHPTHVPAHLILARGELLSGRVDLAVNRIKPFVGETRPAPSWIDMTKKFASDLFDHEIESAKNALENGGYLDAKNKLKMLESFCVASVLWECPETLFTTTQMAYHGMYNSFLRVARMAYLTGKYSLAEFYTEMAISYQQENPKYITNSIEAITILRLIYEAYLQNAEMARNNFDTALAQDFINRAIALCQKYPCLGCVSITEEATKEISIGVNN